MSEDDERDAFEDIYSQLAEFRQRLEELEQLAESKVVQAPKAAPRPAERGYVAPKTVKPNTLDGLREEDSELIMDVDIVKIGNIFTFKRKDGNEGKGCRILVKDHTAQKYLVLWNDQTDIVEELREGQAITIHNCYAKLQKGQIELQLDRQGKIVQKESHIF